MIHIIFRQKFSGIGEYMSKKFFRNTTSFFFKKTGDIIATISLILGYSFVSIAQAQENENSDLDKELLSIEEEINSMKKNVFAAKSTLQYLRELVVKGNSSGSKANIWLVNNFGSQYVIQGATFVLDGESVFSRQDGSGDIITNKQMIFDGDMGAGEHVLAVELKVRGQGSGVFKYVDKYVFTVRASNKFSSEEGQNCAVSSITEARSPFKYTYEERPQIVFNVICSDMTE